MKVLVCGGRDFNDYEFVEAALNYVLTKLKSVILIEGGAKGADSLARQWAIKYGIEVITVPAKWETYGKKAGPMRNMEMLSMNPSLVVAFEGGKGTEHMVKISTQENIPVWQPKRGNNVS